MEQMEQKENRQDQKLLSYISLGINTLIIAHILYVGQLVNSTSQSVIRFEENIKIIVKQIETTESKIERLDSRLDQVEATRPNTKQ
jgi:uncharacterized protein YpmS